MEFQIELLVYYTYSSVTEKAWYKARDDLPRTFIQAWTERIPRHATILAQKTKIGIMWGESNVDEVLSDGYSYEP